MSKRLLSLQEAADYVGLSKATLHRAVKAGEVTYKLDNRKRYKIDPADMARAYPDDVDNDRLPERMRDGTKQKGTFSDAYAEPGALPLLKQEIAFLKEKLENFNMERDRERSQLSAEIDSLRKQLDKADEQRGAFTKLLEAQNNASEPYQTAATDKAWWQKLVAVE
ncbi:MAG: helix-turn-helix domain-containing protein [Pseudomonadota bacterium]